MLMGTNKSVELDQLPLEKIDELAVPQMKSTLSTSSPHLKHLLSPIALQSNTSVVGRMNNVHTFAVGQTNLNMQLVAQVEVLEARLQKLERVGTLDSDDEHHGKHLRDNHHSKPRREPSPVRQVTQEVGFDSKGSVQARMRQLHVSIAKHVDLLISEYGETAFHKDDIFKMVKESMKSDGVDHTDMTDEIDLGINGAHLVASKADKGKYFLKKNDEGLLELADKHLLEVFD